MFGSSKQTPENAANTTEAVAHQPPGQVFPWPKGMVLTALDETIIALPMGLFDNHQPMESFLFGPADMQVNIPKDGDTFLIRLQPGMSVSIGRPCQARVVADDKQPRRFKISGSYEGRST